MIFEIIGKTFGIFFNLIKNIFDLFTGFFKNITDKLVFLQRRMNQDEKHLNKFRDFKKKLKKQKQLCDEL